MTDWLSKADYPGQFKDMSVVILTPCGGFQTYAKFTKSLANMVAYSWMQGLKVYQMGISERMVVHWARNHLVKQVIDKINEYDGKKFTHILWLDDDHAFNPDLAVHLAKHNKDIVSGLYYGRCEGFKPVCYVKDETDDKYKHYPIIDAPNELFECDAVGFGCTLMKREVFEKVPEPWFALKDAGEDIYFCVKAKEHGYKIFCDGAYKVAHLGEPNIVAESTYLDYKKRYPDKVGEKVKIQLGGKLNG